MNVQVPKTEQRITFFWNYGVQKCLKAVAYGIIHVMSLLIVSIDLAETCWNQQPIQ